MLPDLFIQQLKQYSDIERVVSGYVQLKKKGRYLVGLCPFHSESQDRSSSIRRRSPFTALAAAQEEMSSPLSAVLRIWNIWKR